ncbi:MAG: c-type cytochrome [Isosphaeraceae bacterium]
MAILALTALLAVGSGGLCLRAALADGPDAAARDDDDPDEAAIERALSLRLFEENCLMCHTEEMVTAQRLTPVQWTAEVEKMIGFGAPVPPEEVTRLIDYLTALYPADKPRAVAPLVDAAYALRLNQQTLTAVPDAHPGVPERGAALFARNCAICHGETALGGDLGTNLVEKPVLLTPIEYTKVVQEGRRRMPDFKGVITETQEDDILAWLWSRKNGSE